MNKKCARLNVSYVPEIKGKEDDYLAKRNAWKYFQAENYEYTDDTELTLNLVVKNLKQKNRLASDSTKLMSKSSTAIKNGDGITNTFKITHGLSKRPNQSLVEVEEDARSIETVTWNESEITVTLKSPPKRGFQNIKFHWRIEYIEEV